MWVSGFWRIPPPGMHWVPGHWQAVEGGWLWVSGFWTPDGTAEVQYLPPPPPSLDQGPSTDAPNGASVYAPGTWIYVDSRYAWRPGFWIPFRPHWVWVPAHFIWTPSGCLFVDGYWDHPFDERGFLFAPVFFNRGLWGGGPYVPSFVIQPDFLIGPLFVRLANRHFYFGDYFDPLYDRRGFVAWPDYHPTPRAFDPAFAYYRSAHLGDAKWEPALRSLYSGRRGGEIPRPPRTLTAQSEALRTLKTNRTEEAMIHKDIGLTHLQNATVLTPLSRINTVRVTNLTGIGGGKVVPGRELKTLAVTKEEHDREIKSVTQMRGVSVQRRESENKMLHEGNIPVKHTDPPRSVKLDATKPLPPVVERQIQKPVPMRVEAPVHEVRPIPKYEPPPPAGTEAREEVISNQ